jgi:hypothetical protein
MKPFLRLLLLAATLAGAAEPAKPAAKAAAKPAATKAAPTPEQLAAEARVQAMQSMVNEARRFPTATAEAKAFFDRLRTERAAATDVETRAALDQALAMDPAGDARSPLGKDAVRRVPAPAGTTPETKLAELERQLDLGDSARALTAAEIIQLTESADFPTAHRALRLLRRVDPAAAAPLLWQHLAKLTSREQVQLTEDELLRLPVKLVGASAPAAPTGALAAKAAFLRVAAVRPAVVLSKTALLPLLRTTAANEVSEAAWDAVPRVFTAADRAELQVAAKDLFEEAAKAAAAKTAPPRLYPRVKSTIEALR